MSTFVGVPHPNYVYVGVEDRAAFDKIAIEAHDHGAKERGHVLTKSVEQHGVTVIFQHWVAFHPLKPKAAANQTAGGGA